MKRSFITFIAIILLFILTSCQWETPFSQEKERKAIPYHTKIEKSPLVIEYMDSIPEEDHLILLFQVNHNNQSPIQTSYYDFHWPNYLFDENGVPYQVKSFELLETLGDTNDENNLFYIKATINPAPHEEDALALLFPLFITPSLFESGYPIYIREEEEDHIAVGDLILQDVLVKDKEVSFFMHDAHPDSDDTYISYSYRQWLDEHAIYPLFQTISPYEDGYKVELQFSKTLSLPLEMSIQRTSAHLPEWKFSFIVPTANN